MSRRVFWTGVTVGACLTLYLLPSAAFITWLEVERWLTKRGH